MIQKRQNMNRYKIAAASIFTMAMVCFTSCEDEVEIVWIPENMGATYTEEGYNGTIYHSIKGLNGKTISDLTEIHIVARTQNDFWDSGISSGIDVKYGIVGGDTLRADNINELTINLDQPLEEYFIHSQSFGVDGEGNKYYVSEPEIVHFYYVPNIKFNLSRDFDSGKYATTIKWNIDLSRKVAYSDSYYGYYDVAIPLSDDKRKQIGITIDITSDEAPCDAKPITLTGDVDSIYVTKNFDNSTFYTKHTVYDTINGYNSYMYEEAYRYTFNVNVKIPVGSKTIELSKTIKSILIDKDQYAIDDELNIYNIVKIGNDVWTIDNYRGEKVSHSLSFYEKYANAGFYFYSDYGSINEHIINGYHVATESDWKNMESYLGMKYTEKYDIPNYSKVFKGDDVTTYADYFAKNIPWHVFDPDHGYADRELMDKYPFSFHVHYAGSSYCEDLASFASNGGYPRVISKKYKSMCRGFMTANNVRLVKDR